MIVTMPSNVPTPLRLILPYCCWHRGEFWWLRYHTMPRIRP